MTKLSDMVQLAKPDTAFLDVWMQTYALESTDEFHACVNALTAGQALHNAVEEQRKAEKKPFLEGGKLVDERFKPLRKPLEDKLAKMRDLLQAYEASTRALAVKQTTAETKRLKDKDRVQDIVALAKRTPVAEAENISWVEDIEVTVDDLSKVDPSHLVIDKSKTKTLIKKMYAIGVRDFPGMTVTPAFKVRVTAPKSDSNG